MWVGISITCYVMIDRNHSVLVISLDPHSSVSKRLPIDALIIREK